MASVWAEYEIPEVLPERRAVWELTMHAGDQTVRRHGQVDTQDGRSVPFAERQPAAY